MGKILQSISPTVWKTVSDIDDTLEQIERLYVENVSFNLAPNHSTAQLIRRYGLYGGANFEKVSPIDLRDKTIVIKYTDSKENEQQLFAGICINPSDDPHGDQYLPADNSKVPTGDSKYVIYSPDFMLSLVPVDETFYDAIIPVKSAKSFNGSTPDGELIGNRANDKTGPGSTWFFQPVEGSLWRQSDIIEYLLERIGSSSLIPLWTINYATGIKEAMQKNVFSYNPKNKSVRQCLNELISPDRGLAWHCTWPDITEPPIINIVSISDTAISAAGSELLPANTDTINLAEDIQSGQGLGPVNIQTVQESTYSQVEVFGENIRVMGTFKFSATQMANNWYATSQTEYKAATDEQRAIDKYEPVYQYFNLNETWDYKEHSGTDFLYPDWDNTNAVITQWEDPGVKAYVDWRMDRSLPLALQSQPSDKVKKQFRKPFLAIFDDSKYYISDKRLDKLKIGFTVADGFFGIMLKSPYNHATAIVDFGASNSNFAALYEISAALLTASFYTDQPMSLLVEGVTFKYVKKKSIYIPGLHLWVAQAGTVVDVKADGTLETISQLAYYRDDRETLKSLTAFAAAWYGRQRNIVKMTYNDFQPSKAAVGQVLTQVYSGGSFTVAGTIVSTVNYNFSQQTTNIATEFPTINLPQIYTLRSRRTSAQTARDVSSLRSALNDIPLREINSASSGAGAYTGYYKVIKTATGYSVVDGSDSTAANCGYVNIGNTRKNVPKKDFTDAQVSGAGAFYIETTYSAPDFSSVIKFALGALPTAVDGTDIKLIYDFTGSSLIQRNWTEHNIARWV